MSLEAKAADIRNLNEKIATLQEEVKSLQEAQEQLQEKADGLQKQLDKVSAEKDSLASERDDLKGKLEKAESDLNELADKPGKQEQPDVPQNAQTKQEATALPHSYATVKEQREAKMKFMESIRSLKK